MHKQMKTALVVVLVLAVFVFALSRTGVTRYVANWYQVVRVKLFPPSLPDPPKPTDPDDIDLLQASQDATANAFGDLPQVLAALPQDLRLTVLYLSKDPATRLIEARAWAMTKNNMTGDPSEIELFFKRLEVPVDISENDDELHGSTDKGEAREVSLYALMKAIESDAGYESQFKRMRDVAMANIGYRNHAEGAADILELLDERGALDKEAKAALDKAIEHPLLQRIFYKHLKEFKKNFAAGRPD